MVDNIRGKTTGCRLIVEKAQDLSRVLSKVSSQPGTETVKKKKKKRTHHLLLFAHKSAQQYLHRHSLLCTIEHALIIFFIFFCFWLTWVHLAWTAIMIASRIVVFGASSVNTPSIKMGSFSIYFSY